MEFRQNDVPLGERGSFSLSDEARTREQAFSTEEMAAEEKATGETAAGETERRYAPEVGLFSPLWWALTRRPYRWPSRVEQPVLNEVPDRCPSSQVAWVLVGHSTVLLQLGGMNILFDPMWSQRCSPVSWAGPRRVRSPAVSFEALPPIDLVLLSHNHYDHCDRPTLERLAEQHQPQFVTGRGTGEVLRKWGIERVEELEWWGTIDVEIGADERLQVHPQDPRFGPGRNPNTVTIDFVPTRHFSARGLTDRNRALWGGFWLSGTASQPAIYFCGDSGWDRRLFEGIEERKGSPDLAFLPIGAYNPRWFMSAVHVNPEEAVKIHQTLGCKRSVAMHCATFQLTDEAIDEPERRLGLALKALGVDAQDFTGPRYGVRELLERKAPGS